MAMWLQYFLFMIGLAFVYAFAKVESEEGSALASLVSVICALGMSALFWHALTGGA